MADWIKNLKCVAWALESWLLPWNLFVAAVPLYSPLLLWIWLPRKIIVEIFPRFYEQTQRPNCPRCSHLIWFTQAHTESKFSQLKTLGKKQKCVPGNFLNGLTLTAWKSWRSFWISTIVHILSWGIHCGLYQGWKQTSIHLSYSVHKSITLTTSFSTTQKLKYFTFQNYNNCLSRHFITVEEAVCHIPSGIKG